MKIAIIGYGRMGHMIEEVARERGHEIVCTIDQGEEAKYDSEAFRSAEVAIEFSVPAAAVSNIGHCLRADKPVVSGTTGWLADFTLINQLCMERHSRFLYGSNFSVGVNLFWAANKYLAGLMERFTQYKAVVNEVHHTAKLDHPSGTAITTAEQIIHAGTEYKGWQDCGSDPTEAKPGELPVTWDRQPEVSGIHEVKWISDEDVISLRHEAFSRRGFALGAVMGAEWLVNQKPGMYNVSEMFDL